MLWCLFFFECEECGGDIENDECIKCGHEQLDNPLIKNIAISFKDNVCTPSGGGIFADVMSRSL